MFSVNELGTVLSNQYLKIVCFVTVCTCNSNDMRTAGMYDACWKTIYLDTYWVCLPPSVRPSRLMHFNYINSV